MTMISMVAEILKAILIRCQTEIIILLVAFVAHVVFFGSHSFIAKVLGDYDEQEEQKAEALAKGSVAEAGPVERPDAKQQPEPRRADAGPAPWPRSGSAETSSSADLALLRKLGSEKRLLKALESFRGMTPRTCTYNTLLSICNDCGDALAADRMFQEAVSVGLADVVTYNTMIKNLTQGGKLVKARGVMASMRNAGLQPNAVTFNELLDALVRQQNMRGVWELVDEMQRNKVIPNMITVSILLKSMDKKSSTTEVYKVMSAVNCIGDQMDEVLLSSVLEACIRAGRKDLLKTQLRRYRAPEHRVPIVGTHTFGSLFRAYGQVGDVAGLWEEWRRLRSMAVMPTTVTFGCMVEAVATNGDPDSALELLQEMWSDSASRHLVNSVAYCSVIKSYAQMKKFDQVWQVYEGMQSRGLQCSIANFNALFDACARGGEMARSPLLLEEMKQQGIEPNLITWSTILKGYCLANQLDRAFNVLEVMKEASKVQPDEVVYNTLLDGCARQGSIERGMKVLEQMEASDTSPTNWTLSVLVKMANRGGKLQLCFDLVDTLPKKYDIKPNSFVYNNLIQACMQHKDAQRGMEVFETMLGQKVRPDARTYSIMLRGCVSARMAEDAAGLARCAWGLKTDHPIIQSRGGVAVLKARREDMPTELATEVVDGLSRVCHEDAMALALLKDLAEVPGIHFDPKILKRLTDKAARSQHASR